MKTEHYRDHTYFRHYLIAILLVMGYGEGWRRKLGFESGVSVHFCSSNNELRDKKREISQMRSKPMLLVEKKPNVEVQREIST